MGSPTMFIDNTKNPYVELVQLYLGKPLDPRPSYTFPNIEAANKFADNNITMKITDAYVYDEGRDLKFEYHLKGIKPLKQWNKATGGWSSL